MMMRVQGGRDMAAGADAALVARLNAAIEVGMAPAVWADLQPDRAAVHEISGRARSFGELNANANRIARLLRAHGLKAGTAATPTSANSALASQLSTP
jgi:non-ribosomal peptide synthetase component F